jgi:POT family proton-dependent oligopeptide transporter
MSPAKPDKNLNEKIALPPSERRRTVYQPGRITGAADDAPFYSDGPNSRGLPRAAASQEQSITGLMGIASAEPAPQNLFGHPKGLTYLFATEMWERFSYYGMRSLLVLYMVKYLLHPDHAEHVLGFATLRATLQFGFGPLDLQPLASQIYGLYTGLVYLTPILGGLIADRVFGQRHTVIIGAVLMAIGHFMMAFESLFLVALLMLILGNGAFKPNISTQVGGLYGPGDRRRDRAYSIFYVGINVGAFFSPLVCGTLGEEFGWSYGFGAAGIGMVIALVVYLTGLRGLPPDLRTRPAAVPLSSRRLTGEERRAVASLLVLFLPLTLFWAGYEQQGNTIALWADSFTDRSIDLGFWTATIPTTWFQAFNPFMIFAFTPLVVGLWRHQAKRGSEPSTIAKIALGCLGLALANLMMAAIAWHIGDAAKASWLWLFGYFAVITVGELYLSPTGLSLVTKTAPPSMLSLMMGIWLATSFTGNFLAGWLGSFWSGMGKAPFFLLIAAIGALAGAIVWAVRRPLDAPLNSR